jgi:hypothetical protein
MRLIIETDIGTLKIRTTSLNGPVSFMTHLEPLAKSVQDFLGLCNPVSIFGDKTGPVFNVSIVCHGGESTYTAVYDVSVPGNIKLKDLNITSVAPEWDSPQLAALFTLSAQIRHFIGVHEGALTKIEYNLT